MLLELRPGPARGQRRKPPGRLLQRPLHLGGPARHLPLRPRQPRVSGHPAPQQQPGRQRSLALERRPVHRVRQRPRHLGARPPHLRPRQGEPPRSARSEQRGSRARARLLGRCAQARVRARHAGVHAHPPARWSHLETASAPRARHHRHLQRPPALAQLLGLAHRVRLDPPRQRGRVHLGPGNSWRARHLRPPECRGRRRGALAHPRRTLRVFRIEPCGRDREATISSSTT